MATVRVARRPGVQLVTMGNDVPQAVRQNLDRVAGALDNLQAHGTQGGDAGVAQTQRRIDALAADLSQLRTLVNALNQRLTAAGF